ncbi:MAG: DUF2851 family protein [Chloroflexi bacterium]|nr:DUF2851 family protein [Chloroflexota bacterium]
MLKVCEPGLQPVHVSCPQSHVSLSERELSHLWEGQRFPRAALNTRQGQRLRVVYRGRRGGGPGPDFRDAVVATPWGRLQGDIELHVRASDFRRHGHGRDPAYDGLALHVVFWDDEGEDTPLASGRRVPVAALAPWAQGRARQIRRWLERPALWQEPCRSALSRLGADAVAAALDETGDRRFGEKVAAMRLLLDREPADEALWRGLLEALGYGGDRQAFRELALRLSWRRLSAALSRLPPGQRLAEGRRLLLAQAPRSPGCAAGRGRPGNDPWRRLEGAARLAVRFCEKGLAAGLSAALTGGPREGMAGLLAALSVSDVGQALRRGSGQAFIGRGRALEMLANVVLPYFAASGDARLSAPAGALYGRLPLPVRYGAVRHLHEALGPGVAVNTRRQQGMLNLLRRYCSQGGCGKCPLS